MNKFLLLGLVIFLFSLFSCIYTEERLEDHHFRIVFNEGSVADSSNFEIAILNKREFTFITPKEGEYHIYLPGIHGGQGYFLGYKYRDSKLLDVERVALLRNNRVIEIFSIAELEIYEINRTDSLTTYSINPTLF